MLTLAYRRAGTRCLPAAASCSSAGAAALSSPAPACLASAFHSSSVPQEASGASSTCRPCHWSLPAAAPADPPAFPHLAARSRVPGFPCLVSSTSLPTSRPLGAVPVRLCSSAAAAASAEATAVGSTAPSPAQQKEAGKRLAEARRQQEERLRELRRQWATEEQARRAAKAAEEAAFRQEVEVRRAERAEARRASLVRRTARQAGAVEATRVARVAQLARAARYRALKAQVFGEIRETRRQQLLEQSRHWVTAESLDARVAEALDNPVPLYAQPEPPSGGRQ